MKQQRAKQIYYRLVKLVGKTTDKTESDYIVLANQIATGLYPYGLSVREAIAVGWL